MPEIHEGPIKLPLSITVTFFSVVMALAIAIVSGSYQLGIMVSAVKTVKTDTDNQVQALKEQVVKDLTSLKNVIVAGNNNIKESFKSEFALRDFKINYAFDVAKETEDMHSREEAEKHEDLDNQRYYLFDRRIGDLEHLCVESRKRITTLEEHHENGYTHNLLEYERSE